MAEISLRDSQPSDLDGRVIRLFGCGTLGSRVALHLAHWGVPYLVLYDPKVVQPRNVLGLSSQKYRDEHVGKPKVEMLARMLREINPGILVETWHRKIEGVETLSGIVMDGLDSFEGRVAVRDSCFQSPNVSLHIHGRLGVSHGHVFALDPRNLYHQDRFSHPDLWKPFGPPGPEEIACGATQSNMIIAELAAVAMVHRLWA
jgi:molybdopterin/thiamine biosynthesis adenylyltransferase